MPHKKHKKAPQDVLRTSIKTELAKPRMARSARIAEHNLDTTRNPELPSITIPATIDKIIPPPRQGRHEKAQIAVTGAERNHRDFQVENDLTDENGDGVKLKKGAHVDVTVTAKNAGRPD